MLLEQVVEKAKQEPEYDWEDYYNWLFREEAGREIVGFEFWECKHCLSINLTYFPARYGKCRGCELIQLPT